MHKLYIPQLLRAGMYILIFGARDGGFTKVQQFTTPALPIHLDYVHTTDEHMLRLHASTCIRTAAEQQMARIVQAVHTLNELNNCLKLARQKTKSDEKNMNQTGGYMCIAWCPRH